MAVDSERQAIAYRPWFLPFTGWLLVAVFALHGWEHRGDVTALRFSNPLFWLALALFNAITFTIRFYRKRNEGSTAKGLNVS